MAIVSQENILSILTTFNPWWQNGVVPKAFVKEFHRSSYYTCRKSLLSDLRRIVVMSGARRTGKTTIMYQLIHDLLEQNLEGVQRWAGGTGLGGCQVDDARGRGF